MAQNLTTYSDNIIFQLLLKSESNRLARLASTSISARVGEDVFLYKLKTTGNLGNMITYYFLENLTNIHFCTQNHPRKMTRNRRKSYFLIFWEILSYFLAFIIENKILNYIY